MVDVVVLASVGPRQFTVPVISVRTPFFRSQVFFFFVHDPVIDVLGHVGGGAVTTYYLVHWLQLQLVNRPFVPAGKS